MLDEDARVDLLLVWPGLGIVGESIRWNPSLPSFFWMGFSPVRYLDCLFGVFVLLVCLSMPSVDCLRSLVEELELLNGGRSLRTFRLEILRKASNDFFSK